MNDNSKATDLTCSNAWSADDGGTARTGQPVGTYEGWKPSEDGALNGALFSANRHVAGSGVRLTALAVPTTLLAAETTTQDVGAGDILSGVLGGLFHGGAVFLERQPLLTVGMAVGLVGIGYLKLKSDFGLTRDTHGFAPRNKLRKTMGRHHLVKNRKVLRPSLADVPARTVDTNAVGTYLGRDRRTGLHLYMAIEDSSVMVAPPGAGKTAKIASWVIDAPGAVLATSVKTDIIELTEALRARVGRIHVWNPQNIGGRASTIAWDPVIGCSDPEHGVERSMRRANYLLDGSDATAGVENRSFWETASYSVLKAFLWAADAAGLTLLDVARWTKSFRNDEAIKILEKHAHPDPLDPTRPVAPRGWRDDLLQVQKVEGKPTTGENVFGTLSKTFMFLDSPQVQEVIERAHRDGGLFDIRRYLKSQDTLYLLGRDTGRGGVGPLFSALTGEIYEAAREMAPLQPGGRLDAPWSLILDEAALICSVPLEKWTSDARGLGIAIHAIFQSRSQIRERYGRGAADTIWTNMVKLILGGLAVEEDLEGLSKLCGRHKERRESHSESPGQDGTTRQSSSYTWGETDTMTPSQIMNLEPGSILVLRRQIGGPVIVQYTAVWDRPDVKELNGTQEQKKLLRFLKGKTSTVSAPAVPVEEPAAAPTMPQEPAAPWQAPAAQANPWTADPAASDWSSGSGPRGRLRVVGDNVVPPQPSQPPVIPDPPAHEPTVHLEQAPQQDPKAAPAKSVPLRKTGTENDADPYAEFYNDDDDLGGL
ncbi:type IV secretory system conjugative DNA transfer family protein [Streptomyces sp. NPDC053560]|uniref:type IV secretory system conjugative DNA transfer family protein n=1 Tax=Streptomyces sp. NPDC053560 TaxID=3365711 RepID=UPI0037D90FCD